MRGFLTRRSFFSSETSPTKPRHEPLTDWELATRLSYFCGRRCPTEFREAADAGLERPRRTATQTLRMLEARRHTPQRLAGAFRRPVAGHRRLGHAKPADPAPRWVQDHHISAMATSRSTSSSRCCRRTKRARADRLRLDFLNEELLRVYKIERKESKPNGQQHLVRVDLPDEYRYRAGSSAQGAMAVSAYPRRSSPVLRGVWVLDKMLGVELPPPPPDVPKLDESQGRAEETLRERLEQHRADPACATCHDRIDPIGFALENFDELGRWRDRDDGGEIDAVAVLADGKTVDGLTGLKHTSWNTRNNSCGI